MKSIQIMIRECVQVSNRIRSEDRLGSSSKLSLLRIGGILRRLDRARSSSSSRLRSKMRAGLQNSCWELTKSHTKNPWHVPSRVFWSFYISCDISFEGMCPKFVGDIAQSFLNGFAWFLASNFQKIRSYLRISQEIRKTRGLPVLFPNDVMSVVLTHVWSTISCLT